MTVSKYHAKIKYGSMEVITLILNKRNREILVILTKYIISIRKPARVYEPKLLGMHKNWIKWDIT